MRGVSWPGGWFRCSLRAAATAAFLGLVVATGCGGGGGGGGGEAALSPSPVSLGEGSAGGVTVRISPAQARVEVGEQVVFTASVTGDPDARVHWTVREPGGGTVGEDGRYTAPTVPGTYHVEVWSAAEPEARASATVTVDVDDTWLAYLNYYRSLTRPGDNRGASRRAARAGMFLPPVEEDPRLSAALRRFAQYLAQTDPDDIESDEEVVQGSQIVRYRRTRDKPIPTARTFIEREIRNPFFRLWVISPFLERVGYARISYPSTVFVQSGLGGTSVEGTATVFLLNVLGGQNPSPPSAMEFPLFFPGPDTVVPLLAYEGEHGTVDPLAHEGCQGYEPPTGLPITVQLAADWNNTSSPDVTRTGLVLDDGTEVEHCWYSEATYNIPLPPAEEDPLGFVRDLLVTQIRTARTVLGRQDMVVLIPRRPLEPGRRYTATVEADGRTYTWSFRTWPPHREDLAWRVIPRPGTVLPGEEIRFLAADATGQPVAEPLWLVNGMPGGGARVGTITPGGTYRAPDRIRSPRVVTVRAEDPADPGRGGEVVFTVAGIGVEVDPLRTVVAPGEAVSIQARARAVPDHPNVAPDVDFLVEGIAGGNEIVGRINPNGQYTAPDAPPPTGRVAVLARSRKAPWAGSEVEILFEADRIIAAPGPDHSHPSTFLVRLAPAVAEVPAGARVDFDLFPSDLDLSVGWTVESTEGTSEDVGTIDPSGLYIAPTVPPGSAVTVSARLWNLVDAETREPAVLRWTFRVVAADTAILSLEPREARVGPGRSVAFTVEGVDDLSDVVFEVNGIPGGDREVGTIDTQGTYTAPASIPLGGNTVTVTARLRNAPWIWAEALVRLMGPLEAAVEPSPQRVALGARVAFAALVGGSPVPVERWFVNGTEGGGPEVGTISADGVYQAPPEMPDRPVVITIRAEGRQIPDGAVEVAFDLVELVVTPSQIRTQKSGLHEPVTVLARLSSGQAVDLTGDPSIQVVSDHPQVAVYAEEPEPGVLVVGAQLGTTVVRFQDLGALGRATAAVVVEALPRYRLSTYGSVETARVRSVFPLLVYREIENGPNAGSRVMVATDPHLRYAVEDVAWNTGIGYVDEDASRDPATYTAVLIPSQAEIRMGEIPGSVTFRVEDPRLGDEGIRSFSVELVRPGARVVGTYPDGTSVLAPQISAYAWSWDPGLDSRDLEPRLQPFEGGIQTVWAQDDQSAWSVPASAVPVWVTPKGAPGVNGSAVLVVRADAPPEDHLFVRFRVDASRASFIPLGLSYARRSVYMGSGNFQASPQERYARYYTRGGSAYLEVPLKENYVWTSLPKPLANLGGYESPFLALAEILVHEPGPVDVTVEIPGTVQEPVTVRIHGQVPPLYGLVAWPQTSVVAAGSAAEVAVAFPWALYGLTPVVEYKARSADVWQRAEATAATHSAYDRPLHDAPTLGPRVGGPGLGAGTGITGFSAFLPLGGSGSAPWGGVFDIRVRYAEFPDEPVVLNTVQPPGPALASGEGFAGEGVPAENVAYVYAENTVQLWTEARVRPVRVCAASYGAVRLSFPSTGSYLNGSRAGVVTFTAPGQVGEQVEIPAGGCTELTPNLNVGIEPGDVVAGTLTAERLDAGGSPADGTRISIYYAFTGAQVAVSPNLIGVPKSHTGDMDLALEFRGGATFGEALAEDLYRIAIVRDGQAELVVDGELAATEPVAAESLLKVTFPLPAAYFETGSGPFRIRLEFGPAGEHRFWAGPVEVGLLDVGEPPPVLPLNAVWPGETEPGVITGRITVSGTYAPFHVQLRLEQPGFDPPLVAFSRTAEAEPNRAHLTGVVRDLWITGDDTYNSASRATDPGRVLAFRIYGDRTDLKDRNGEARPDGLPDRVSGREGDLRLRAVRIDRDGTEHVLLDHAFTAFNFVAEHPPLRAPEAAPVADNLSAQQIYDNLSFQVDDSKPPGEAFPPVPKGEREVWLYADNQINLNSGVAGLIDLGYPGTSPNDRPDPAVLDGRWGDFGGEPPLFQPVRPRVTTGRALEPFGVALGGVCFDPWTYDRKRPNSDDLLLHLFADIASIYDRLPDRGGFLYAQGGVSGGWLAPPGFLVAARTPGADLPGLDCGYLARGAVGELSERFEDEIGAGRALYTFARAQGKRSVRTTVHIGGPGAYFEFTTDPVAADGSALCEATLQGSMVFSRAPVDATPADIVLTVRQDRTGAFVDATAKVGVQVLASALAGAITASGPVGIAFSAGVAAAFQVADNVGLMPFGVVDGAVVGTVLTSLLQDAADLTPGTAVALWYELAPSALVGRRVQARAAQVAGRLDEILISRAMNRPDAWWVSPSAYFKSLARNATAGAVASAVASTLYDAFFNAETFSAKASAWAAVADQVALLIPEEAVVSPDTDTGLRGIWVARLKKRELDLDRARALWSAIEDKSRPSSLFRVEPPVAMPFYAALAGGVGPVVMEISPRGDAPTASPGDEPEKIADFRIHVAPDGGTRFPFVSTTVVEVGRSDVSATARAVVNALDAQITLRLVDARIEHVTVDGVSWPREETR